MKAVLISIQPKWCELIANGKKTVEIRKTRPKLETPFKCYIYATKPKTYSHPARIYNSFIMPESGECGSGKVIGEFVCDRIDEYTFSNLEAEYRINDIDIAKTCLNHSELIGYGKGKSLYGWHISELKIYDKPKELWQFLIKGERDSGCVREDDCSDCPNCVMVHGDYVEWDCRDYELKPLTRPPQSWCFVEQE